MDVTQKMLCIYHSNCADGFGAAWAVRAALGDAVEFYPGVYQKPPPDVAGRDVILVDFCYKRPILEQMAAVARSITILDHHKSAAEDLRGLPVLADWHTLGGMPMPGVGAIFDMSRSGAGLAWDYFHPGIPRPALINHIEDRDLWRFKIPGTREIQANLFSYPYDFAAWDRLMAADVESLRVGGEAIERKHNKDIAELVALCRRRMVIAGHNVPVASLPYTLASDAGHLMADGEHFAACYWDTADQRIFSLRSSADGVDVSVVAVFYGGGGHYHAAGFSVPRHHPLAIG